MFCPRCGRAINENANFCGGCGLSRAEIEKFAQAAKVNNEAAQQAPVQPEQGQPVKSEVPFGTVVNEPAASETVQEERKSAVEEIKKIITETADENDAQVQTQEEPVAQSYTYTAPQGAEYHYSANSSQGNSSTNTQYNYTQYAAPVKNENLSTVDFIWMMIISSIPVVGLIYLIWLAIQNDNTNKRSYARATLIISIFATIVAFVFLLGFLIAGV